MSIPLGPVALSNLRGIALSLSNSTYTLPGGINCGGNLTAVDITGSNCAFATLTLDTVTVASAANVYSATFTQTATLPSVDITDLSKLSATPNGSILFNASKGPYMVLSSQYEPVHTPLVSQLQVNKYSTTAVNTGLYALSGTTTRAQITVTADESWVLSCPSGFAQVSNVSILSRAYIGTSTEQTLISGATVQPRRIIFGAVDAPTGTTNYQLYPTLSKLVYITSPHTKYIDGTIMTHTVRTDLSNVNLAAATFANLFAVNPVLSAGFSYQIEFAAVLTGFSATNNTALNLRLSAANSLAFTTVQGTYTTCVGAGGTGAYINFADAANALCIVNTLSSTSFQASNGSSAQINRGLRGTIIVDVTTAGTLQIQFSQSNGPSTVTMRSGSFMRVTCLGTANGTNITDGSFA